jgi:hypothetical protein
MDCTESTDLAKEDSAATAVQEASPPAGRYDFPVPEQHMLDLMAVQLGECTRVVRTFADDIVGKPFSAKELGDLVRSLHTLVQSSAAVADAMDLIHYGRQRAASPAPRKGGTS